MVSVCDEGGLLEVGICVPLTGADVSGPSSTVAEAGSGFEILSEGDLELFVLGFDFRLERSLVCFGLGAFRAGAGSVAEEETESAVSAGVWDSVFASAAGIGNARGLGFGI